MMGGKQLSRSYYPECDVSTAKTTVDTPLHIPPMNDTCTTIEEKHIMRLTTCVVAYRRSELVYRLYIELEVYMRIYNTITSFYIAVAW